MPATSSPLTHCTTRGPLETQHVKRFGNYEIDLQALPQPITDELLFEIDLPKDDPRPLLDAPTSTKESE